MVQLIFSNISEGIKSLISCRNNVTFWFCKLHQFLTSEEKINLRWPACSGMSKKKNIWFKRSWARLSSRGLNPSLKQSVCPAATFLFTKRFLDRRIFYTHNFSTKRRRKRWIIDTELMIEPVYYLREVCLAQLTHKLSNYSRHKSAKITIYHEHGTLIQ